MGQVGACPNPCVDGVAPSNSHSSEPPSSQRWVSLDGSEGGFQSGLGGLLVLMGLEIEPDFGGLAEVALEAQGRVHGERAPKGFPVPRPALAAIPPSPRLLRTGRRESVMTAAGSSLL